MLGDRRAPLKTTAADREFIAYHYAVSKWDEDGNVLPDNTRATEFLIRVLADPRLTQIFRDALKTPDCPKCRNTGIVTESSAFGIAIKATHCDACGRRQVAMNSEAA